MIELVTGDDYEVYVDKNILKPLAMYRTFFDAAPYHLRAHRSHSYFWKNGAPVEARFDFDTGITVSNGGLNAPLDDMAKYMDFLIGNPASQAAYDAVLPRPSLQEMWTPVVPVENGDEKGAKMGLCFFLEEHGGMPFVAHSGSQNGFISHFYAERGEPDGLRGGLQHGGGAGRPGRQGQRPPGRSGRPRLPRQERHSRLNGTVGMSGG